MAMSRDQSRALRLLAGSPLGCTEATLLAHGFTIEMLDALVRDGLATAEQREGGSRSRLSGLTITDIGRQALAG